MLAIRISNPALSALQSGATAKFEHHAPVAPGFTVLLYNDRGQGTLALSKGDATFSTLPTTAQALEAALFEMLGDAFAASLLYISITEGSADLHDKQLTARYTPQVAAFLTTCLPLAPKNQLMAWARRILEDTVGTLA